MEIVIIINIILISLVTEATHIWITYYILNQYIRLMKTVFEEGMHFYLKLDYIKTTKTFKYAFYNNAEFVYLNIFILF